LFKCSRFLCSFACRCKHCHTRRSCHQT
jgi:hypothetical protein